MFKWFLRLLDCKIGLLLNLCSRQEKLRSNVIRCRCQLETCNLAFVTRCFFWWWHLWRWWRWGICPIILFKRLFFANECLLAFSSSRSCQILFDPKNIVLLPPSCALINLFPLSVCFFVYLRSFVAFFCPLSSISLSMAWITWKSCRTKSKNVWNVGFPKTVEKILKSSHHLLLASNFRRENKAELCETLHCPNQFCFLIEIYIYKKTKPES